MKEKKALLIINPFAGKKRVRSALFDIVDTLSRGGYVPTVRLTSYSGHATEIAKEARPGDFDIIVCSGGDGTLNETVSGLLAAGSDIPIGYIPAGSTNDFASTLGLSKDIKAAAEDIINGKAMPIDIGLFGERFFSYVASFGIFTRASYSTAQNAKNLLGSAAYVIEGIKDLGDVHEYHMTISADGKIIDDTFIFGAISNSTSLGGIITIDPTDVCLDDGLFEYLFVKKPRNIADLMRAVNAISSYDYESDQLYFGSARELTLKCRDAVNWSLDGECASAGNEVTVTNAHRAVKIILPDRKNSLLREPHGI